MAMFKYCLFFISASILMSCIEKPDFPSEPSITFESIKVDNVVDQTLSGLGQRVFKDSVTISIGFRDGDGDLGVNETDKEKLEKGGKFNYVVSRLVRRNGKFVVQNPIPSHSGIFVNLKAYSSKPGPIEGSLTYSIDFLPLNSSRKDTVKFEVKIIDRANNESNVITTDSVLVNRLTR